MDIYFLIGVLYVLVNTLIRKIEVDNWYLILAWIFFWPLFFSMLLGLLIYRKVKTNKIPVRQSDIDDFSIGDENALDWDDEKLAMIKAFIKNKNAKRTKKQKLKNALFAFKQKINPFIVFFILLLTSLNSIGQGGVNADLGSKRYRDSVSTAQWKQYEENFNKQQDTRIIALLKTDYHSNSVIYPQKGFMIIQVNDSLFEIRFDSITCKHVYVAVEDTVNMFNYSESQKLICIYCYKQYLRPSFFTRPFDTTRLDHSYYSEPESKFDSELEIFHKKIDSLFTTGEPDTIYINFWPTSGYIDPSSYFDIPLHLPPLDTFTHFSNCFYRKFYQCECKENYHWISPIYLNPLLNSSSPYFGLFNEITNIHTTISSNCNFPKTKKKHKKHKTLENEKSKSNNRK